MPLELRELIIRTTVENSGQESSGSDSSEMDAKANNIKEIAEMVLELIKQKIER